MNNDNAKPNPSPEEVDATFRRLRALKKALRPHLDSNLLASEMIKAVITEGWDTGPRIRGTMKQLGFNEDHAGITLAKNRGYDPKRHHWSRGDDHRYIVHEDEAGEHTRN